MLFIYGNSEPRRRSSPCHPNKHRGSHIAGEDRGSNLLFKREMFLIHSIIDISVTVKVKLTRSAVCYKGLGSGRVKIDTAKIAKFQSRKIIDVLSCLICLDFDLSETFKFDAVSILKHIL